MSGRAFSTETTHPAVGALPGNTELFSHMSDRAMISQNTLDEQSPPANSQASINVGHEDLRFCEDVRYLH